MENTFNCNSLFKCFSLTSNETLQVSVYNASASMSVFRKNSENRQPIIKMAMSPEACLKLVDVLKSLLDAQPETRIPFIQMVFNKESRNYEQYSTFVFFKDEKKCYGIEVTNRQYTTPIKFILKSPNTFTIGSEPMSEDKKSLLALRYLIQVFEHDVPLARNLTRFNMKSPMSGRAQPTRRGNYSNPAPAPSSHSNDPYGSEANSENETFF